MRGILITLLVSGWFNDILMWAEVRGFPQPQLLA